MFPDGFLRVSVWSPQGFLKFPLGFPFTVSLGGPSGLRRLPWGWSVGFPEGFLRVVPEGFPSGFCGVSCRFPAGFLRVSVGFPSGFCKVPLGFSYGLLRVSFGCS